MAARLKAVVSTLLAILLAAFILLVPPGGIKQAEAQFVIGGDIIAKIMEELFITIPLDYTIGHMLDELLFGTPGDDTNTGPISREMQEISQTLTEIKQELAALTTQLGIKLDEIELYTEMVDTNGAIDTIDTYYAEYMRDFCNKLPGEVNQQVIDGFAANVMSQYIIQNKVTTIQNNCLPSAAEGGVLGKYTDLTIRRMGDSLSAPDFSVKVECTNGQPIVAERPMYFGYGGWDGGHNALGAAAPGEAFYFAEGTCRPGFDSYLCVQNPGAAEADVTVTYMLGNGTVKEQYMTAPAGSRTTVTVKDMLGEGDDEAHDFSAKVECVNGQRILAERSMYFDYRGWSGGHDAVGAAAPGEAFYFAEGTCRPGFDSYLCVQNPGAADAEVKVIYMLGDGTAREQFLAVPAGSRSTVTVKDFLGEGDDEAHDFSAKVECVNGQLIVAERPMYFDYRGWSGGHDALGVAAPGEAFYFAEGTCRPGFDSYLCVQNPGAAEAEVRITYMRGDGSTAEELRVVPPSSRVTVTVDDFLGEGDGEAYDFSTRVECINGQRIVAERPIYFDYKGFTGGHVKAGADQPSDAFYFAEGTMRPGFTPFLCVQNPGDADAEGKLTMMMSNGTSMEAFFTVGAHSRRTFNLRDVPIPTLWDYYVGLENFFMQMIYEETCGVAMVLEARNLYPDKYGSASDYINDTGPGGFKPLLEQQVDQFLACVERMVMSQAAFTEGRIELPDKAAEVLARADFVVEQALGRSTFGLKGRIFATQDRVAEGAVPKLTARNNTTGEVFSPTVTASRVTPWQTGDGSVADLTPRMYAQWSADHSSVDRNDEFTTVRYTFAAAPPGDYDIVAGDGTVMAQTKVSGYDPDYTPDDGGSIMYGDFIAPALTSGNARFMDYASWADNTSLTGTEAHGPQVDNYYDANNPKTVNLAGESKGSHLGSDQTFDYTLSMWRTFVYQGNDMTGSQAGSLYFNENSSADVHRTLTTDHVQADYAMVLEDVTAGKQLGQVTRVINDPQAGKDKQFDENRTTPPLTGQFLKGHTYKFTIRVHISAKIKPSDKVTSSIILKLNQAWLSF